MIRKDEVFDCSREPPDLPEVILVEIAALPRRAHRERIPAIWKVARWLAVVSLALLVAILLSAVIRPSDRDGARPAVSALAREPGPAGVAAAYGYRLSCLSVTILGGDPPYARADFNHASACGRFTGYSTAIFLRAMGAWRPVLEAVGYVCPVASLPVHVQAELGVCPSQTAEVRGLNRVGAGISVPRIRTPPR